MFSLPLLYTMEVWWAGFVAGPLRLCLYIVVTFILLLGYNYYAGMHRETCWSEVAIDSVEELGLGLMLAAAVLFLIGRISLAMNFEEVLGTVVIEAMTVAIGISVGTAQMGIQPDDKSRSASRLQHEIRTGGQLVVGGCGAILFAANIAPTEEVVAIATSSSIPQLLALMLLSLVLAAVILYFIEFSGSRRFVRRDGVFSVVVGTFASYAVALLSAALVLWFFGRFDREATITILAETVVLGLPSTLGASAGRLLVQ